MPRWPRPVARHQNMSVIIILMLASLAVGLVFVGAFVWSVRSGQYEDTLTPGMRVLADDAAVPDSPVTAAGKAAAVKPEQPTSAGPENFGTIEKL
jgi:cbb3-type cytochrome oxidase maturation protein